MKFEFLMLMFVVGVLSGSISKGLRNRYKFIILGAVMCIIVNSLYSGLDDMSLYPNMQQYVKELENTLENLRKHQVKVEFTDSSTPNAQQYIEELENKIENLREELEKEKLIDPITEYVKAIVTYVSGVLSSYLSEKIGELLEYIIKIIKKRKKKREKKRKKKRKKKGRKAKKGYGGSHSF